MTVTFSLTADDFTRFQKVIARRFRQKAGLFSIQFFLRVLVWMCIGFAGAGYARLMTENPDIEHELRVVAFLLAGAIIAITAMPHLSQVLLRKHMLSPEGAFLSPQTVEFTDRTLIVTSPLARTELLWSALHAKDEDSKNYYLFIDPMQALVLPRSSLEPFRAQFEKHTSHLKNEA
jgi:YcxB-like protein